MKTENIVKDICKKLSVSQKQLAKEIGVSENTIGNWARGNVPIPEWAIKMFSLLDTEKKYNIIKQFFLDNQN